MTVWRLEVVDGVGRRHPPRENVQQIGHVIRAGRLVEGNTKTGWCNGPQIHLSLARSRLDATGSGLVDFDAQRIEVAIVHDSNTVEPPKSFIRAGFCSADLAGLVVAVGVADSLEFLAGDHLFQRWAWLAYRAAGS